MEWFRFYDEALNDPKVQRLPGDVFKTWVNLLCLASQQPERGTLPPLVDSCWALRMDNGEFALAFEMIERAGLVEQREADTRYIIHGWDNRQRKSDDVTSRVQKHRENGNVTPPESGNGFETLHETDLKRSRTDTDTDTEKNRKDTSAPGGAGLDNFSNFFEEIWPLYPARNGKKIGRNLARAALQRIPARDWELIRRAVTHYAESQTAIRGYAKDANRFFANGYWREWIEPEKEGQNGKTNGTHEENSNAGLRASLEAEKRLQARKDAMAKLPRS